MYYKNLDLDTSPQLHYTSTMSKELISIQPEHLEVANAYLMKGNVSEVAAVLGIPGSQVSEIINKREVKRYLDTVYLDQGYRNRGKLGSLMDKIIDSKLEEAEESEIYSSKDLADLLWMAHKMRMEEIKAQTDSEKVKNQSITNQTNVQINNDGLPFGDGNYGKLMEKLLQDGGS